MVTAVLFRCALRYGARFPRGAFPRQSAVRLGFSAMSRGSAPPCIPSHPWLAPREPGCCCCWGSFTVTGISPPSVSLFIHKKSPSPIPVPKQPQRCTGTAQPNRSSRECVNSSAHGQPNALTDEQVVSRWEKQLEARGEEPRCPYRVNDVGG